MFDLSKKHLSLARTRLPSIGIILFLAMFIFASTLYPGGSQADLDTQGFDWINNYWCNLLNKKAMNGKVNPARPFAILAMLILCLSLALFFIQFARQFATTTRSKNIIQVTGCLSMLFAMLLFTEYHDQMSLLSSFFGVFAVLGIIRAVYKSNLKSYKVFGLICIVLLALNNYIYFTEHFIQHLPLLQKITLGLVLLWVIGLNHELYKKLS